MSSGAQGVWVVMGGGGQDEVIRLVRAAFDQDVNFIDTANVYSLGKSQELLGTAIKKLGQPRDDWIIATKSTGNMDENTPNARGQPRHHTFNCYQSDWFSQSCVSASKTCQHAMNLGFTPQIDAYK